MRIEDVEYDPHDVPADAEIVHSVKVHPSHVEHGWMIAITAGVQSRADFEAWCTAGHQPPLDDEQLPHRTMLVDAGAAVAVAHELIAAAHTLMEAAHRGDVVRRG